jgi:hypothetical protein
MASARERTDRLISGSIRLSNSTNTALSPEGRILGQSGKFCFLLEFE